MLGNDRTKTASTEFTSIRCRNDKKKSTRRIHRYFVDFESWIHVKISTSNWCHNFLVDSPFKIDEISTKFPRGISTSNRWRIDEDVSIGLLPNKNWWHFEFLMNQIFGQRFIIFEKWRYRSQLLFKLRAVEVATSSDWMPSTYILITSTWK